MDKMNLRLASRAKQYVMRGHGSVGLALSVLNTCIIWFGLVPFINTTFGKLRFFLITFIPAYLVFVLAFGYWDMKRGTYRHELTAAAQWNPVYQDVFYCFKRLGEKMGDPEIVEVAEKWVSRRPGEGSPGS